MSYNARFRVWRGDDADGELEDFTVEVNEGEVVLDIIHRLQATQTPDLAVRWNCKAGKCGSCSAEVNGRPRLMCMTRMSTFTEDEVITVTPLRAFPVIKDLVTDVSFNYEKAREVPAFAPPADLAPGEYRMQQVDVERSQEFRKCIECFLCQDTCHVVRDHEENKQSFAGPRFFIRLAELDMHPLDTKDRKREAQDSHGLGMCNITKCCTEVCPEHIKITDNAIIPMKERVVDTKYDPLVWLGNKIPRRSAVAASRSLVLRRHRRGRGAGPRPAARQAVRPAGAAHPRRVAARPGPVRATPSDATRTLVEHAGRGRTARMDALSLHAWVLLCAVEAGQLPLERGRGRDRRDAAAGAAAGQHRHRAGRHARPAPAGARAAGRGGRARPRGDRLGPRPLDPGRRPGHALRGARRARRERRGRRRRWPRRSSSGRTTRGWPVCAPTWRT